ncbi:flagellar basal body P-ring formation chaperone FlgA [Endozoicomonadaceae bacterium StTr2]
MKKHCSLAVAFIFALHVFTGLPAYAKTSADKSSEFKAQIQDAVLAAVEPRAAMQAKQVNASSFRVVPKPLGNRLNLTACDAPLTVEPLSSQSKGVQKLKVSCSSPKKWKVHTQARIEIMARVLFSNTTLPSGSKVNADQVSYQEMDIAKLKRGYITRLEQLHNKTVRRTVRPNTLLTPSLLREAILIKRGDRITITSGSAGIIVQMAGVALEDGAAGKQIRVKNLSSGKVVHGRIKDAATVITDS